MICVGRDAKEVGLGFGGGGRAMEDTELEEGEACSYHNNNDFDDYDATVDPDIDLSYIDEKLQHVLGHFQKDFEGGVSAENLGAKFGGYGSFLPAYQRSPVWSHSRTPPKSQQYNVSKSPNNLQGEGGWSSSSSVNAAMLPAPKASSASVDPAKQEVCVSSIDSAEEVVPRYESVSNLKVEGGRRSSSVNAVILPIMQASSSLVDSVKQEVCIPSSDSAEELVNKYESVSKKPANLPDPKMLKVRIKMGPDNLSTQNNAAIYSGLGLDVSPSSSLDDSPSESEGMSHEPQDAPFDSPNYIIRIMTSFPVHGLLLSPLSDDLTHFTGKEKISKEGESFPVPRVGADTYGSIVNGCESTKGYRKLSGERSKGSKSSIDGASRKEVDLDSLTCEELVSNTSKLPNLSNLHATQHDLGKGMSKATNKSKEGNKGAMKDKGFSDLIKEGNSMPIFTQEDGLNDNSKPNLTEKVMEEKKASSADNASLYLRKDGNCKGEKHYDSVRTDSGVSIGKKGLNSEQLNLPKEMANQKATSYEQEIMKLPPGKDSSSSEGKKKPRGSQGKVKGAAEMPKESSKAGSFSTSKNKKATYRDNSTVEGELEDLKSQKNSGKAKDRYRDFFGDMELDQENLASPSEMSYEDRLKDLDAEKSTNGVNSVLRERSSGKKIDKTSTSEAYLKAASSVPPLPVNGPIPDAAPAAIAPVVMQENWVCCDKCQKWRLLPLGKNPNDLPEKWLCSMLNWLPGKNRCSFSEEETTNALRALYQVPIPECHSIHPSNLDAVGILSNAPLAGVCQPDQNLPNFGSHAMSTGGKKKHGVKESSSTPYNGTTQMAVGMNGNLNDLKRSPMVSETDYRKLSKSSDTTVEKIKHKKKEKHKVFDSRSDGGDTKQSKIKAKRDLDQDFNRSSKKMRTTSVPETWTSDHVHIEKAGPGFSNGFPTVSSGRDLPIYNDHTSRDSKLDQKDPVQVSAKKPKDKVRASLNGSTATDGGKQNHGDVSKKRKLKESNDAQAHPGSFVNSGNHVQDRILSKEELSENNHRKDKKARVSRLDGKDSSASKGSGRTDKKGGHKRNQRQEKDIGGTPSHRSLDGVESLKRDSGSLHPSAAATSSSSKVSGSHKSKTNFHEVKGSPVESVSSSPMRVSKPEKLKSIRRNLTEKDYSPEPGYFAPGGEDDGGSDRSGTARKEKLLDMAHHGSLESSVPDFQEKDSFHVSGGKAKVYSAPSPDHANRHFTNGSADVGLDAPCPSKSATLDSYHGDERQSNQHYHNRNASSSNKSGKGSSTRSKDKSKNIHPEFNNGAVKISDPTIEQPPGSEVKAVDGKNRIEEKIVVKSEENENTNVVKKDLGRLSSENVKREGDSNFEGHSAADVKVDASFGQDPSSSGKQSVLLDSEMVSKREKFIQNDANGHFPQPVSESCKRNGPNSSVSASRGDNALKAQKKNREAEHANGIHHSASRNPSSSGHRVKDLDARSPIKKDSYREAANNALKEAKNLKHLADRLKNSGSTESTKLYFEASLKFLHGASLLECCSNEGAKTGEMIQSMQIYSSTAKLCEFCAHEYEKSKDMAAAALAYKCMEVAYMRVICSSHSNANRDRYELQSALQMIPPGESPSSSASDVDNLNHPTTLDKVPLPKGISSPQVTGNHMIAARNRPNFIRLLSFVQEVNFAMEASKKSRAAFAAANVSLGEAQRGESITSIKTALDFNFQDVEGLLRLVRLAVEAISR